MLAERNLVLFHANGKLMKIYCFKQLILTIFITTIAVILLCGDSICSKAVGNAKQAVDQTPFCSPCYFPALTTTALFTHRDGYDLLFCLEIFSNHLKQLIYSIRTRIRF